MIPSWVHVIVVAIAVVGTVTSVDPCGVLERTLSSAADEDSASQASSKGDKAPKKLDRGDLP